MKNTSLTSGWRSLSQLVMALFLLMSSLAGTYAACCAGHGGIASCNKSTGHPMCKDGSASPTCTCTSPKTAATTATKSKATKKTAPATTTSTTTKPKSNWWGGKSTTATPASNPKNTSTSGTSTKGCCSGHGGIAQCNKSSGHQMCKDSTSSPTCTCQ